MYFTKVEIENIKCFGEKVTLDLTNEDGTISPWTLILGDNGIGKTTLLKSIVWMMPVESPEGDNVKLAKKLISRGVDIKTIIEVTELPKELIENLEVNKGNSNMISVKPYIDDIDDDSEFSRLARSGANVKSRIGATLANNTKLGNVPDRKNIVEYGFNITIKNGDLYKIDPETVEVKRYTSPNLYAYSANRHMALKNLDTLALKNPIYNLFSESGDLYDAEQILSDLDHTLARENDDLRKTKKEVVTTAADLLTKVKSILVDLLPYIDRAEDIIVYPRINKDGSINERLVMVKTPDGVVPLDALSLGYKTMFAWIVDLALRMIWRSPDSKRPLNEPAVVIVDEIDLHLHPKWQKMMGKYLRNHFPNTQFICTAHSPIMAQSSADENLCVLYRDQLEKGVKIENEPEIVNGWKIGQVITNLFNISERSPEIDEMMERRRKLLDQKSISTQDEKELKSLDKMLADLPIEEENQKLIDQLNKLAEKVFRASDPN